MTWTDRSLHQSSGTGGTRGLVSKTQHSTKSLDPLQADSQRPFRDVASRHASLFLHVFLGSFVTSALVLAGADPVLASSGVTIFYLLAALGLQFKAIRPAAMFCGTFAGMTSFLGFFNKAPSSFGLSIWIYFCIAIVTGFLYVLTMHFEQKIPNRMFSGYGGRLGAIAFIGSVVCLMTAGLLIRLDSKEFQLLVLKGSAALSTEVPVAMILVSAVGSLFVRIVSKHINSSTIGLDVVLSASFFGFLGETIFPSLHPLGTMAALYWYAGNFAGMSSDSILDSPSRVLLAGAATGVFLAGLHYFAGGAGGLLGFSAFLAVIVVKRCAHFADRRSIPIPGLPATESFEMGSIG